MKYITTDKHPVFIEGINFQAEPESYISIRYSPHVIEEYDISEMLRLGYIKEVEEKEFTKSDIQSFYKHLHDRLHSPKYGFNQHFDTWLKDKK